MSLRGVSLAVKQVDQQLIFSPYNVSSGLAGYCGAPMNHPDRSVLSNMVSELATTRALLNCLIKEFALPENCLSYSWPAQMQGIAPGSYLEGLEWKGIPLTISLPNQQQCFKQGLLLERGGRKGNVIRLLPPLIIDDEQCQQVIQRFDNAMAAALLQLRP